METIADPDFRRLITFSSYNVIVCVGRKNENTIAGQHPIKLALVSSIITLTDETVEVAEVLG